MQYKPIFFWKEWEVWDFIEGYNLPYPSLYDEGFGRIGCIICPFIVSKNRAKVNMHMKRWPKYYQIFEKVVADWFKTRTEKQKGRYPKQTVEEYLELYYQGFPKNPNIKYVSKRRS